MADQTNNSEALIGALGEAFGEQLEKQRKKAEPIPDVYTSGMRGNEKPPSQQETPAEKKKREQAQARRRPQVAAPGRNVKGIDEEDEDDEDGRRPVTFKAKPRSTRADLEKENADLKKKLAEAGKKKKKFRIA